MKKLSKELVKRLIREEMKAQVENYVNQTMQGIAHSQTLSDLEDGSDWGRYFSTMLGSQTFNTAVMFGTGGAALPILTAQAMGSKYGELEAENKESSRVPESQRAYTRNDRPCREAR